MKERGGAVGDGEVHAVSNAGEALVCTAPVGKAIPAIKATDKEARAWNTRHLGSRIGADALAAASAGVLIAPIISIIDR
jgi:hypothetical protein